MNNHYQNILTSNNLNSINFNIIKNKYDVVFYLPKVSANPLIIKQKNETVIIYSSESNALFLMLFYVLSELSYIDSFFDFIKFKENNKFNFIKITNDVIESFYFRKNKTIIFEKSYFHSNDSFFINYDNQYKYNPIKQIIKDNTMLLSFYDYSLELNKIVYSFDIKEDKPLFIEKNNDNETHYFTDPIIKPNMTLFLKPTKAVFFKSELIDFEYLIDSINYTLKFKEAFSLLNIINPLNHSFSNKEKEFIFNYVF